jgi:hypothetical protein
LERVRRCEEEEAVEEEEEGVTLALSSLSSCLSSQRVEKRPSRKIEEWT